MLECDGLVLPRKVSGDVDHYLANVPNLRKFHTTKDLKYENVRLSTFHNWNVSYIKVQDLAKSGFFYLGKSDHVQCTFCQGVVGFWEIGDHPEAEHKKHFPHCPLFQPTPCGNIPLFSPGTTDGPSSNCYKLLNEYLTFRLDYTKPPPKINSRLQRDSAALESQVMHPIFSTYQSRLATYGRWPEGIKVMPDKLAEAGFFYTGLSDFITCFNCGGGLFNWNKDDANLDPWVDHAKYYGECSLVRVHKDFNFINTQRSSLNISPAARSNVILTNEEAELLLNHPIAQRVTRMGLSRQSVKAALKKSLENYCHFPENLSETLEMVVDWEEEHFEDVCMNATDSSSSLIESESIRLPSSGHTTMPVINVESAITRAAPQSPQTRKKTLLNTVEELRERVVLEKSRLTCKQCKAARVKVVVVPCNHFHLCDACAKGRGNCPTCGAVVRGTLIPVMG